MPRHILIFFIMCNFLLIFLLSSYVKCQFNLLSILITFCYFTTQLCRFKRHSALCYEFFDGNTLKNISIKVILFKDSNICTLYRTFSNNHRIPFFQNTAASYIMKLMKSKDNEYVVKIYLFFFPLFNFYNNK